MTDFKESSQIEPNHRSSESALIGLVMCGNCSEWQCFSGGSDKSECVELNKFTDKDHECPAFNYDPARFCTICGGIAVEAEHSTMNCSKNDAHVASQWDYEWQDFSK